MVLQCGGRKGVRGGLGMWREGGCEGWSGGVEGGEWKREGGEGAVVGRVKGNVRLVLQGEIASTLHASF